MKRQAEWFFHKYLDFQDVGFYLKNVVLFSIGTTLVAKLKLRIDVISKCLARLTSYFA